MPSTPLPSHTPSAVPAVCCTRARLLLGALTASILLLPMGLAGQGPGASGSAAGLAASLEAIADPVQQRRALEEAVQGHPKDARLHLLLARSLRDHPLIRAGWQGDEWTPSSDRAKAEFRRAIELDSMLEPAVIALASMALVSPDTADDRRLMARLAVVAERPGSHAEAYAVIARLAATLGDLPAAARAAERTRGSPVQVPALHAVAVAELAAGQGALGMTDYFTLLRSGGAGAAALFLTDVADLVERSRLVEWRTDPGVADSILRFWDLHAALAGVSVEERLVAHFQRMRKANLEFARVSPPEAGLAEWTVVDRMLERRYDGRGILYVKLGPPTRRVGGPNDSLQIWIYQLPDGSRSEFGLLLPRLGVGGYRIVPPSVAIPEGMGGTALALLRSIQREHEGKERACPSCPTTREMQLADLEVRDLMQGLSRESYVPQFKAELPFSHATYVFRAPDKQTDLLLAAAVPLTALKLQRTDPWIYEARATATVFDSVRGQTTSVDTTVVIALSSTPPLDAAVVLPLEVRLPWPARGFYRLALRAGDPDEERGRIVGGPLALPGFPPGGLAMSDVVLATSRRPGWRRGGVSVALNPAGVIEPHGRFTLFYEVYNLPAGGSYSTTI
ncbi:MAG TPA: hypothetical protein VF832_11415, partial [Longimicrobiales bacterium]